MNKFLFFLLAFTLFVACDPTDPPEEDPIVYPITYAKTDYDIATPIFLLIEEGFTTSVVSPSTSFSDFTTYFETEEYPEIFEFYYLFESIQLLSDTTADVVTYDGINEVYNTTHLFYEQTIDQIILRDSQSIFEYAIELDADNNRLINCDVVFTNSFLDPFSNEIEYAGFDASPCSIYPSDDLAADYLAESPFNVSVGDTLAQINISGYFNQQ